MRIGQDQTVGADDEARALAAERLLRVGAAARVAAGQAAEEGLIGIFVVVGLLRLPALAVALVRLILSAPLIIQ